MSSTYEVGKSISWLICSFNYWLLYQLLVWNTYGPCRKVALVFCHVTWLLIKKNEGILVERVDCSCVEASVTLQLPFLFDFALFWQVGHVFAGFRSIMTSRSFSHNYLDLAKINALVTECLWYLIFISTTMQLRHDCRSHYDQYTQYLSRNPNRQTCDIVLNKK